MSQFYLHTPRSYATEWTIPAFALPAEAGTHVPTPEGWKAELALAVYIRWDCSERCSVTGRPGDTRWFHIIRAGQSAHLSCPVYIESESISKQPPSRSLCYNLSSAAGPCPPRLVPRHFYTSCFTKNDYRTARARGFREPCSWRRGVFLRSAGRTVRTAADCRPPQHRQYTASSEAPDRQYRTVIE